MGKYFLLNILFAGLTLHAVAQFAVCNNCRSAYTEILSLRFAEAEKLLLEEQKINPDNQYLTYLENYRDFLSVFISEDKSLYNAYQNNKSGRIDKLKKISDKEPFKNYLLGNVYIQSALIEIKFADYLDAAFDFNRAYRLIEENSEEFPGFLPNKLSMGVLSIMVGLVPENYRWFLNLLSIRGSVEAGRKSLLYVYEASITNPDYSYLQKETLFYLGFIDLNINPEKKNIQHLLKAIQQTNDAGLLLGYLAINMQMKTGMNDAALTQFQQLGDPGLYYPFTYLDYLQAECLLRKLDLQAASVYYKKFNENFNGKNYLKDAKRKQAWILLLQGDTANYFKIMKDVRNFGNLDVDIDREAQHEAESGIIPEIKLLQARLLFDGGYYEKTEKILLAINKEQLDLNRQVEQTYRLGRIFQETENMEKAKLYYEQTILKGRNLSSYFAGNSALKMAEIFEQEGNKKKAEEYYSLCLDLSFEEYENSIHSKAKAGLERVSK